MSADTGKTIAMPERAFFNAHPISGILEEGTDGTVYIRADLVQHQIDAARAGGVREGLERAAWLPMESAPRDGTLILLMGYPYQVPVVGMWENVAGVAGWSTDDQPDDLSGDGAFQGWLPIPPIRAELDATTGPELTAELSQSNYREFEGIKQERDNLRALLSEAEIYVTAYKCQFQAPGGIEGASNLLGRMREVLDATTNDKTTPPDGLFERLAEVTEIKALTKERDALAALIAGFWVTSRWDGPMPPAIKMECFCCEARVPESGEPTVHADWCPVPAALAVDVAKRLAQPQPTPEAPIPTQAQNPNGLHQRFILARIDGKPIDPEAEYFVLRLDDGGSDPNHIAACRKAILVYADAIAPHIPQLAADLRERYAAVEQFLENRP